MTGKEVHEQQYPWLSSFLPRCAGQEGQDLLAVPTQRVIRYGAQGSTRECSTYQFARLAFADSVGSVKAVAMKAYEVYHDQTAVLSGQMEQIGRDACDLLISMASHGAHIYGCAYLWIHHRGVDKHPSLAQLHTLVVGPKAALP